MDWSKLKITAVITMGLLVGTICSMLLLIFLIDKTFFLTTDFWRLVSLAIGITFPICFIHIICIGFAEKPTEKAPTKEEWDEDNLTALSMCGIMTNFLFVLLILLKYIFGVSINFLFITSCIIEGFYIFIAIILYRVKRLKRQ